MPKIFFWLYISMVQLLLDYLFAKSRHYLHHSLCLFPVGYTFTACVAIIGCDIRDSKCLTFVGIFLVFGITVQFARSAYRAFHGYTSLIDTPVLQDYLPLLKWLQESDSNHLSVACALPGILKKKLITALITALGDTGSFAHLFDMYSLTAVTTPCT